MRVTIDVDLEKFRYSLVGDSYLLEEVKAMSDGEFRYACTTEKNST